LATPKFGGGFCRICLGASENDVFLMFFINKMAAAVILNGIGLRNGVAGVKITPINGVNYTPYS